MSYRETTIELPHQSIAVKLWGDPNHLPVLALHGWLDNAATFDRLAPYLQNIHLIAIDLPGHGHSGHKPPDMPIHLIDFVIDTIRIARALSLKRYAILGHSLGAAIASLVAGTVPQEILGIALIDGLGPLSTDAPQAPYQLQSYIQEISRKKLPSTLSYATPSDAVDARLKVGHIKRSSVETLVERGLKENGSGKWCWRTDPRLLLPPAIQLTEDQVLAFIAAIEAPVLVIRPDAGYPFPPELVNPRLTAVKNINVYEVPGEHHVHLDTPEIVAKPLNAFFKFLPRSTN